MGRDLDATATQTEPDVGAPFVRVYRARENAEAMGALPILDSADLKETRDNPSYLGLDADEAHLASGVGYDILGQLRNLAPYS